MKQIVKILILTFLLTNNSFAQLSKVQIEIGTKKLIAEIAETDEEQSAVSYTHLTLPTNREV